MSARFRFSRIAWSCAAAASALTGAQAARAEDEAPAIIVYGRADGYDIEKTRTATKTETALIDVPQSVSVLSREQLDDQGLEQLGDALRYVPGVVLGQGEGHRDQVSLRGQNTTADFFLDGLRDDAQYYRALYNIERVEVLKGANALIFGRGGGGGVINRVSKAPEFSRNRADFSAGVDTLGAWSLAADVDRVLSDSAAVRLNATWEDFASHRDFYSGHFLGLNPTLGLKLGEATRLTASYEYAEDRRTTDRGVPSLGGLPLKGFDDTFFGVPGLNHSETTAHIARLRLDHEFGENLKADLSAQYASYDKYYGNIYARGATAAAVELEGYDSTTTRTNWVVQGNLVWKGETGGLGHQLLVGFEAGEQDTDALRSEAFFGTASRVTVPLAQVLIVPAARFGPISRSSRSDVRTLSAYVQDQIDLGDHVKLVAGLRYDNFRISSANRINQFGASREDGKWSPRLGLIVKPQENLSFYASFAKSFLPQSGDQFTVLDATTATLAPEEFRNLEVGAKWDLTDRLALTAALYQLDRKNTRASDPITGNTVLSGSSRARGFEAALVGQITPQLQVTLGYALQDGEIRTTTTAAPAGRPLAQLPRHQASAFARYDITDKLGVALGVLHQSSQFATISNAVRLPAFTRVDAAVFYEVSDRVELQVNVENLTDADYFPSAHTDNNISTGKPLNARLTMRMKL